jgi:hypothetical protein
MLTVRSEIGPYRRPSQRYFALPKIIKNNVCAPTKNPSSLHKSAEPQVFVSAKPGAHKTCEKAHTPNPSYSNQFASEPLPKRLLARKSHKRFGLRDFRAN